MRVLVTGASGAIGAMVCDALLARGDEVVGLTRDPARARRTNPTVTWHEWQPTAARPPAAAVEGAEAVVNLVGEEINQRWSEDVRRRIRESRERATKNLVDALVACEQKPRVLVSQAAVGYYGVDHGPAMLDEDHPPGDDFLARVVVAWEAAARQAEGAGIRVVRLRTGLVLDPGSGLLKQLLLPFRLGLGGPLGSGEQYVPWIHRDDEVAIFLWALDNDEARGVYNAAAPNPVTNRELARALGQALRRPAVLPAPKLAVAALRGRDVAELATGSQRVVPRRLLDAGFEFRFPEIGPALEDLVGKR